jgi:heat shock protein HspQ
MAIKTYMLTIEYNDETDTVEYLQEEVLAEDDNKDPIRAIIDLEKYFDKELLEYIRRNYIIGET